MEPPPPYPGAMVNVTNHCNLECKHCFIFREGNPNRPEGEMKPERLLSELERLRDRHGVRFMMWMGGEPMLRWRTVEKGLSLFRRNHITTNGTVSLKDFGPDVTYVISLDGPREANDVVRGAGVFDRVMKTIAAIPEGFRSGLVVQCVMHRENQDHAEELVRELLPTKVPGMTFSFYVPRAGEVSPRAWESNEERESAVDLVFELKRRYLHLELEPQPGAAAAGHRQAGHRPLPHAAGDAAALHRGRSLHHPLLLLRKRCGLRSLRRLGRVRRRRQDGRPLEFAGYLSRE